MAFMRRLLGIFVMIAGVIGLLLSLAGLAGLVVVRPALIASVYATIDTLSTSIDTSQQVMVITDQALGATVGSVDALAEMLATTALTVEDTQPVLTQVNGMMGETLPDTLKAATDSLDSAKAAAQSLEGAIKSFEAFRGLVAANPLLSMVVPVSQETYQPDVPLAESLGDLATSLDDMPATFTDMADSLDQADNNLELVKANLVTMSDSVAQISISLGQYRAMVGESKASMDNMKAMLTGTKSNLPTILAITTLVLALFFLWLLAAQVVIFSQGLELFHGTATRMDTGASAPAPVETQSAD